MQTLSQTSMTGIYMGTVILDTSKTAATEMEIFLKAGVPILLSKSVHTISIFGVGKMFPKKVSS